MEVQPTRHQEALIRTAIAAGRLLRPEDAIEEALSLWETRERRRSEILSHVDLAEGELAQSQGRAVTQESLGQLAFDVGQRGRTRLAAERLLSE